MIRNSSHSRRSSGLAILLLVAGLIVPALKFPTVEARRAVTPAGGRPLVIAHRGGARESTENTIEAFQRAAKIGADGIETDLRLTRDGVVVIYHDERFGRVEGLVEAQRTRRIADMTYDEISRSTLVGVGDDSGGRRVPTLGDLLSKVRGVLLNIELKRGPRFDDLVKRTAEALKSFPELDRVILEAPDLETAEELREQLGRGLKLHINPGYDESVPFSVSLERVLKFRPHSVSVSYKKLSIDVVEAAHKAGVEVWVWTVDAPDIARAMATLGADAIKTDRPSMLLDLFSRAGRR